MALVVSFAVLSACGDAPTAGDESGDDLVWDFEVVPFDCNQNPDEIAALHRLADHASNVEFGPCGHLVYRDDQGTGWLVSPNLDDVPLSVGDEVIGMSFSPQGAELAVVVGDDQSVGISLVNVETGSATRYAIEDGLDTFGNGYRTGESGSIPFVCSAGHLQILEGGEFTSVATDVGDCRRTFGQETGPTLIYTTETGDVRVANLNSGAVSDLFTLEEPYSRDEDVVNTLYPSRDGTLLTHVFSRSEMCGDTYCGRSWARPYNLVTGERLGEVEHGSDQEVAYWIGVDQASGHVAATNLGGFTAAVVDPDFNFSVYEQTTVIHLLEDGSGAIVGQADSDSAYRTESIALLDFADGSRTRLAGGSPVPHFVMATNRGDDTVLTYPTETGVALHNLERGVIACETGQNPEPEWIGSRGDAIWTTSLADYTPGVRTPRAALLVSADGQVVGGWQSGFWTVTVHETSDALLMRYSTRDEQDIDRSSSTLQLIDPETGRGLTLASQTAGLADVDDTGERLWYTVRDVEAPTELPALWVGRVPSAGELEPLPELSADLEGAVRCGE